MSEINHVLNRPDMYIGPIINCNQNIWVYDQILNKMVLKNTDTYNSGLLRLFYELLSKKIDGLEH